MCKFIIKNLKLKNFHVLVFLTLFLSNFISVAKSEIIEGFCLVKRSDLKAAKISEGDYSRFLGKEINYLVSFDEMVLADISEDTKLSVITGSNGSTIEFKKISIGVSYKSEIEVIGDKETDKLIYKYNNKLRIVDNKITSLYAVVDQTGFSTNKWDFQIDCRDRPYNDEEKLEAKKLIPESNLLKKSTTGTPPPYFFKLAEKIKELGSQGIDGTKGIDSNYGWLSKYSLFIEEDFDTVLFFESPLMKGNKSVRIISYGGYEYFNAVYSRNINSAKTFVQPASFKKSGDMESYMKEGFKIKNFEWKFNLRDGDEIMESSNVNYTNNIEAYIASNTSFTVSTINDGWWYAGTFKLVNNIEDFYEIYKKNKSTYCSILKEELVKNSKNQNIQYDYSDFIDFNKRNNINC